MIHRLVLALVLLAAGAAAQGNVTVTLSPEGDLTIIGDASPNRVELRYEGFFEVWSPSGTINGAGNSFPLPGDGWRPRTLLVDLGSGNDRFEASTPVGRFGLIRMGEGNDIAGFGNSSADALILDMGPGDDVGSFGDGGVDLLIFDGGSGNDRLALDFAFVGVGKFRGGPGRDSFREWDMDYLVPPLLIGFESRR